MLNNSYFIMYDTPVNINISVVNMKHEEQYVSTIYYYNILVMPF